MDNLKALYNNIVLLEKLLLYKIHDLEKAVELIRQEFNILPKEMRLLYRDASKYSLLLDEAEQKTEEFFSLHNNDYLLAFFKRINEIRSIFGLGREWNPTFSRLVISGILISPAFSVFVNEDEEKKIIVFEINKHTTLEDLLRAWEFSEESRLKLFGKTKSSYVSKIASKKVGLIKLIEAKKKEEGLTDKEIAAYFTPIEDEYGQEIPMDTINKVDTRMQNWIKKTRERFTKEVTR